MADVRVEVDIQQKLKLCKIVTLSSSLYVGMFKNKYGWAPEPSCANCHMMTLVWDSFDSGTSELQESQQLCLVDMDCARGMCECI
jgi:hypothetical protein